MHESLLVVTDRMYEAALDGTKWPDALRAMASALGGTACGLRFESFITPAVEQTWIGLEPEWERAYVAHYWTHDIWASEARANGLPGTALASDHLISPELRKKNAFINELCAKFEIDDLVGGLVSLSPERMVSFATMKWRGQRPFDEGHAALMSSLIPHVRRALMVEDALRSARVAEKTAWSIVDRLPVGAIVVDARRRVLHQNRAATRMMAAGISLDQKPFRELIATLRPIRVGAFTAVAVRLPDEETPFGLAHDAGRTLVLITDPAERVLPPIELLMTIFGLTLAEARVALLVGGGLAPKEAANELGTAWNTVRAQLRHVFAKTHTSSQSALVRLLAQLGLVSV
jgi:DNA-binding CsgD family transcriptional regulator